MDIQMSHQFDHITEESIVDIKKYIEINISKLNAQIKKVRFSTCVLVICWSCIINSLSSCAHYGLFAY